MTTPYAYCEHACCRVCGKDAIVGRCSCGENDLTGMCARCQHEAEKQIPNMPRLVPIGTAYDLRTGRSESDLAADSMRAD